MVSYEILKYAWEEFDIYKIYFDFVKKWMQIIFIIPVPTIWEKSASES